MLIVAVCSFPFEGNCSKEEGASRFALEALQAILAWWRIKQFDGPQFVPMLVIYVLTSTVKIR